MPPTPEPVTDWMDDAPEAGVPPVRVSRSVMNQPWWNSAVGAGTGVLLVIAILVAPRSVTAQIVIALCGSLLGMALTLVGTAWGTAVVFADSTRKGLWFALFPPYMVVYTIRHWPQMHQAAILFLCGLALALGSLFAPHIWQSFAPSIGTPGNL